MPIRSHYFFLYLLVFLVNQSLFATEKMIFAIDLIRHGDRTPIQTLDTLPYPWKEDLGQLTSLGMQQHEELGKKLRKRYVEQEHLLPALYESGKMYVRSTDVDRTLMSAQTFLLGLYPIGTGPSPSGYQPIPIHSQPKENDVLIPNKYDDEKFSILLEQYVYSSQKWQAMEAQSKNKWEKWSKLTARKMTSLNDVIGLGSILNVYQLYHVPFSSNLTSEDIEEIIAIFKWGMAAKYEPIEIGHGLGYGQLKLICDYLMAASQKQQELKYVLLSEHDTSLLSLMSALGAPLNAPPPYASQLNFALYENEKHEQKIVVRFNDELVSIPGCDQKGCTLEQFSRLLMT